jgi:hypothetical protein
MTSHFISVVFSRSLAKWAAVGGAEGRLHRLRGAGATDGTADQESALRTRCRRPLRSWRKILSCRGRGEGGEGGGRSRFLAALRMEKWLRSLPSSRVRSRLTLFRMTVKEEEVEVLGECGVSGEFEGQQAGPGRGAERWGI